MRTTLRPAGVLVVKGSPSGMPSITHQQVVAAGQYPGPVYPLSLAAAQRGTIQWASGRANKNRLNFGYEPSAVQTQLDNASEYLLRSEIDGRLYWVTPLKPRTSDSQRLLAYSLTPADAVQSGSLNQQRVYVFDGSDPRVVNLDDMLARISEVIRNENPGFFGGENPGRIAEFLPLDAKTWQAFAELGGRVVSVIEVPVDARVHPTVTSLEETGSTAGQPDTPADSTCIRPNELSELELAKCIGQFAGELEQRQVQPK